MTNTSVYFGYDQINSIKENIELFMKINSHDNYIKLGYDYKIAAFVNDMDSLNRLSSILTSVGIKAKNVGFILNTYTVDKFDCFDVSESMHDVKSIDDFNIECITILEYDTKCKDEIYVMLMKQSKKEPKNIDCFSIYIK